jgi:D-proline reductase (dithiol) PrdB
MASLSDLSLKYRFFMRTYRYRKVDWRPGCRLAKPLSNARLALVTTAGFYQPEQQPFDESIRGGDCSYRILPLRMDLDRLLVGQKSEAFDPSGLKQDKNLAFPLHRFQELEEEGTIGRLNARHISYMGSITAPGRLIRETGPEAVQLLAEDNVDAVFLTPV